MSDACSRLSPPLWRRRSETQAKTSLGETLRANPTAHGECAGHVGPTAVIEPPQAREAPKKLAAPEVTAASQELELPYADWDSETEALDTWGCWGGMGPYFEMIGGWGEGRGVKESTRDTYAKRVSSVWKEAVEALGPDPEARAMISPMQVVERLIARARPGAYKPLKRSSWHQYRNAVISEFSRRARTDSGYHEAIRRLQTCRFSDLQQTQTRDHRVERRSHKRRNSGKDFTELIDQLGGMNRHANWGAKVQYWLQAAIATGIKPAEWEHTRWTDEKRTMLLVVHQTRIATTQKRGRSETPEGAELCDAVAESRDVSVSTRKVPVDPSDRWIVAAHLNSIEVWTKRRKPFCLYYKYARQTLDRACTIFKPRKTYKLDPTRR